ncbi:hypothetical protein SUDANB145_07172 (plasmid) [Streptomyces sp. enrichment culture]|uniref:hypothetical protein n=1 Tax=Streptomyces sp. enrichment culture TaxID=1795815 RepID=UPI003F575AF4
MADRPAWSDLTRGEKLAVIRAETTGVRRAVMAGMDHQPDIDRRVTAVYDKAARRIARDAKKSK